MEDCEFCVGDRVVVNDSDAKQRLGEIVSVYTRSTQFFLLKCDSDGYVNPRGNETIWFTNPNFEFPAEAIVEEFVLSVSSLPAFEVNTTNNELIICSQSELQASRKKQKRMWTLMWDQ